MIPSRKYLLLKLLTYSAFPIFIVPASANNITSKAMTAETLFQRIASHQFHPLNEEGTFTLDRNLNQHGIADLNDPDWKVRLLGVRDLVRIGEKESDSVISGLGHQDKHVRQISAAALGILKAAESISALESLLRDDPSPLVRAQAAMSLGQIESQQSLPLLEEALKDDPERDVRHQCELAMDQIRKGMGATEKQLQAFLQMDEGNFNTLTVEEAAPEFSLEDTEGKEWRLSEFHKDQWTVLIWVFADWCPVCHNEFHELIELQEAYDEAGARVLTLECHDRYRGRVMVGKELEPEYWFSEESFQDTYTEKIWWPHLLDRAGAVGAAYGINPMAFAVHAEYINRPAVVIIDPRGVVRLAYYGTFWGDRPSIKEILEMIQSENFEYENPKRLKQ